MSMADKKRNALKHGANAKEVTPQPAPCIQNAWNAVGGNLGLATSLRRRQWATKLWAWRPFFRRMRKGFYYDPNI